MAAMSIVWTLIRAFDDDDVCFQFQQDQVKKYCSQYAGNKLYQWPKGKGQPEEIYRHLLFDDKRKTIFCFVEKNG